MLFCLYISEFFLLNSYFFGKKWVFNSNKSHNLKNLQDYLDYYHILADAISNEIFSKEINHVLFFNIPHLAYDTIIYQIAMSLKIPITIVTQSLFPDKFFSLEKIECYGDFNKEKMLKKDTLIKLPKLDLFYV